MNQPTPADRDRAQRRVRSLTTATAVGAGALAALGAGVAAGTFAGRTVASTQSPASQAVPTDPSTGLQQPSLAPGDGSGIAAGSGDVPATAPITSGGS